MKIVRVLAFCLLGAVSAMAAQAQDSVTLSIRDVITRQALYYDAGGTRGVVLVHQSGYDAASWSDVALRFRTAGISSIALESTSHEDVQSGIDFLRAQGVREITLMGASIGGGSVQRAVSEGDAGEVAHVVLLGTAAGSMQDVPDVTKLFVVSEGDFFRAQTHASFSKAAAPKELLVYPGAAHGQDMFTTTYGDELMAIILAVVQ